MKKPGGRSELFSDFKCSGGSKRTYRFLRIPRHNAYGWMRDGGPTSGGARVKSKRVKSAPRTATADAAADTATATATTTSTALPDRPSGGGDEEDPRGSLGETVERPAEGAKRPEA